MKVLSINAGSSSMKFTAFEMPSMDVLMSGYIERIGIGGSFYTLNYNNEKIKKEVLVNDHRQAFQIIVDELTYGPREEWASKVQTSSAKKKILEFSKNN